MSIEPGNTIEQMLKLGELAAAINIKTDDPDVRPLIPNAEAAGFSAFESRGHYPINHLVAIRDEVLDAYPDVANAVFNAFVESKNLYFERLRAGSIDNLTAADQLHLRMMDMVDDPLPYGIARNRAVLENLIAHATSQEILRKPTEIDAVFESSTLKLMG